MMKKVKIIVAIALLSICSSGALAKAKPKPIFAKNGNFAIQTNIFAGYDIKGKSVVHIKLTNFQPYTAECTINDSKTKNTAKMTIAAGRTFWIHDATVPLTFDVKCDLKK